MGIVRRCGYEIAPIEESEWEARIVALPPDRALEPYRAMLASLSFPKAELINVSHTNNIAHDALRAAGADVAFGPSDTAIEGMICFMAQAGFLPAPTAVEEYLCARAAEEVRARREPLLAKLADSHTSGS